MGERANLEGRSISHYDLLEKVGDGGMGTVYRAHDRKLDRIVALKFLHDDLLESGPGKTRFLREARAVSRLNHRHIAVIHAIEECDGEVFLVFEYLTGGTLRSRLESIRASTSHFAPRQAADYGLQIADALAHAHASGIIHRDVKPGNIMFAEDGAIKLVDFGLSKLRASENETKTGAVLGTPLYMSPEQAQGKEIDERSDIFSLGVVLYQMVVGEVPFAADRAEAVVYRIIHDTLSPIRAKRPDCPAKLVEIIERALEKLPEARYQKSVDLAADLRKFLHLTAVSADAPTQTIESARPPKRHGLFVGAALALIIVLGLLFLTPIRGRLWSQLPPEKRLAILPFDNPGNDPDGQAFSDGLVESAIVRLERLEPTLIVLPASEIRKLAVNTPDAARKLAGANLVISGAVSRTGKRVQIDLKLLDPKTSRPLASARVASDSGEAASVQDQLGDAMVKLLGLKVPEHKLDVASRVAGANEAYLEGTGYLQRFDIPGNPDRAIVILERATQEDPGFVSAYVALSEAYQRQYRESKDRYFLDLARNNAAKALDLNASSAGARVASGVVQSLGGDQEGAIADFHRAISIDPLNAEAFRELAAAYDAAGRTADAEASYRRAIALRPNDWVALAELAVFHNNHQQYVEAEKDFRGVVALVPDSGAQHRNLGGVYIALGRFQDAERELLKSIELGPTTSAYSNLGALYLYVGRYRDAIGALQKALQLAPASYRRAYTLWGNLADAYRSTPDQATKAPDAYRRAIQEAERQLALDPDNPELLANVAVFSAKISDRGRALDAIGRAMRFAQGNRKISFQAAIVYELTGIRDRALAALGEAVRGGYSQEEIELEPELAKLRQDLRYKSLLAAQHQGR